MNVNELLGKRCLLSTRDNKWTTIASVDEYKILEISPTGQWVKLMNLNGRKFWKPVVEIAVVEVLNLLYTEEPQTFIAYTEAK